MLHRSSRMPPAHYEDTTAETVTVGYWIADHVPGSRDLNHKYFPDGYGWVAWFLWYVDL